MIAALAGVALVAAIAATPTPAPVPTEKPLREIGHVRALGPYCSSFVRHFNGAARDLIAHDDEIGRIDFTLDDVNKTYEAFEGDIRRHADRLNIAAYVDRILKDIPAAQAEVNALRATADLTTNPEQAVQMHQLAAAMQRALDRQKQLASDSFGIAQALLDLELRPDYASPSGSMLPYADYLQLEPIPADELDVKKLTRRQELEARLGDAERAAAGLADTIASSC